MDEDVEPKLSTRRKKALQLLLELYSVADTAKAVGVNRSTIHRWMEEPDFKAELKRGREAAYEEAVARLSLLAGRAVGVLAAIMLNPQQERGAFNRIRAAEILLGKAFELHSLIEMENRIMVRIEELERLVRGGKPKMELLKK